MTINDSSGISIVFIGEVGIAGNELLQVLQEKQIPIKQKKLVITADYLAEEFPADEEGFKMEFVQDNSFAGFDLVIILSHQELAENYAKKAAAEGCLVLDATGAFETSPRISMAFPILDESSLDNVYKGNIVALPLSISISTAASVKPLLELAKIESLHITTLHGVSDLGREAMAELTSQSISMLNFQPTSKEIFPHQLAFNCLPQVGPFGNREETVVEEDLQVQVPRLLGIDDKFYITATALQLPVFYGHCFQVTAVADRELDIDKLREIYSKSPYFDFLDSAKTLEYPHPAAAIGRDKVLLGRLRCSPSWPQAVQLWGAVDNVRFGAALNIERIIRKVFKEKI